MLKLLFDLNNSVRLDRIEEKLDRTLTTEVFLGIMEPFIADQKKFHDEMAALSNSSQRHDTAIEKNTRDIHKLKLHVKLK